MLSPPYGYGMGHLLFAIAFFVGLCLIAEWVFLRSDEKRKNNR
jgi:heme A synthase